MPHTHTLRALVATFKQELAAQPWPELAMDTESVPQTLRSGGGTFKQELLAQSGPELAMDTEGTLQTLRSGRATFRQEPPPIPGLNSQWTQHSRAGAGDSNTGL